jgi:hypothetical protein
MTEEQTAEVVRLLTGEDEETLKTVIAVVAGLLAHRRGADHAAAILARVGVALEPVRGRA